MTDRLSNRPTAPAGCEDKSIAASGGQAKPVGNLASTPSMTGRSTQRKPGKAESGEWAAAHD